MSVGSSHVAAGMWSPWDWIFILTRFPSWLYSIDAAPILATTPEAGSNHKGLEIKFQVGNQELNNEQFLAYINRLPAGPEREAHTLEWVRGMKQISRLLKDCVGYMRKDCSHPAVGISDEDFEKKYAPVVQENESRVRMFSSFEDVLTRDPRAKNLFLITHFWGAEVSDYFRSSTQSKTPLGVVVGAARIFLDYTIARRLINENILIRLENETVNHCRKRYATAMDWYGIKRMTPDWSLASSCPRTTFGGIRCSRGGACERQQLRELFGLLKG